MAVHTHQDNADLAAQDGEAKANLPPLTMAVLGFLGGAFIAMGFLLDIRVSGNLPKDWGSFGGFLGAAVFPVGLILIVIGGGELITGNMMALPMAALAKRIPAWKVLYNWLWITAANSAYLHDAHPNEK